LPARSLGLEYFRYDERTQSMRGERTGTRFGLGDTVTVKLVEAAPVTGGLRFELAEGGTKSARPDRPAKPGKTGRESKEKRRFKPKKR
jgi:ribonuclease R